MMSYVNKIERQLFSTDERTKKQVKQERKRGEEKEGREGEKEEEREGERDELKGMTEAAGKRVGTKQRRNKGERKIHDSEITR